MLNQAQIQTAGGLIAQIHRLRDARKVAAELTNVRVYFKAPVILASPSGFQYSDGRMSSMEVEIEPGRFDPIKAIIIEQLDAQIAAGEAELAKLGVTAD